MTMGLASALACEPLLLSPPRYGEVRVTVTTNAGMPVAGVSLSLYTGQRPIEYAHTDDAGTYTFQRVPAGNYGVIAAIPAGMGDLSESPFLYRDNLDVVPNEARAVSFTFVSCAGSLAVATRDTAGAPAPGVPITLYDGTGELQTQPTASDGISRFAAVGCGEYGVRLGESPSYTVVAGRGTSYADGLRISRAAPDLSVAFQVRRCRATIHVRALDASNAGVAGATVTVFTSLGELVKGVTGADGTLDFTSTPCGMELGVSVSPPTGYSVPSGRGTSVFDGIRLVDGGATDIVFHLTRP